MAEESPRAEDNKWAVITSIYPPNDRLLDYVALGYKIVVVADAKTDPAAWSSTPIGVTFLSLEEQNDRFADLSTWLGTDTYARKNLGYLVATERGADVIWDTDDDTSPRPGVGDPLTYLEGGPISATAGEGLWNPYAYFLPGIRIWPRGFPLTALEHTSNVVAPMVSSGHFDIHWKGVCQMLVAGDPDVDAIYRLTSERHFVEAVPSTSLIHLADRIAPGNTQATIWRGHEYFSHLYVPALVSFRFCDILKMYVSQTLVPLLYAGFLVWQDRNAHNLMNDFESEIPMYLHSEQLSELIPQLRGKGLSQVYSRLAESDICSPMEVQGAEKFEEAMARATTASSARNA